MFIPDIRVVFFAAVMVALFSAGAFAAGNANRGVAPATDAKTCKQLVSDTREMLAETEVTDDTDKAVESMISNAVAQCGAGQFTEATHTIVQARALLTKE
ncbi:MAG: hypothetical protein NXI18_03905 [Alphaproteobacteria bacterium]|nr:hypothetical protein [Alphaproteobacteria bacterium]